jgi:ADP-dependent phosphofructokinase/glucokinase
MGRRRFGNKEDWQKRLEEYQRDLEQELADVTDILKRLREGAPAAGEPQTVRI